MLLGVKNQSNIDISCSHSMYDITVIIIFLASQSGLVFNLFNSIQCLELELKQIKPGIEERSQKLGMNYCILIAIACPAACRH